VWPTRNEIHAVESKHVIPAMFKEVYSRVTLGSQAWQDLKAPEGKLYPWDSNSTYIKRPPFFEGMTRVSFNFFSFITPIFIRGPGILSNLSPLKKILMLQKIGKCINIKL
jgi:hypothetical protein